MRAAAVRGLCVEERRLQEGGARGFVAASLTQERRTS
jgi:hypothetical protein